MFEHARVFFPSMISDVLIPSPTHEHEPEILKSLELINNKPLGPINMSDRSGAGLGMCLPASAYWAKILSRNQFVTEPGRQVFTNNIDPKYAGDAQSYFYFGDLSFIEENLRKFHKTSNKQEPQSKGHYPSSLTTSFPNKSGITR
jgi:hypothetical protein